MNSVSATRVPGGPLWDLYASDLRLLLCGGKGGVGKTTLAAGLAVGLAARHPDRRFLVVSTDPAHSLGDSLGIDLGAIPVPVHGGDNLWGLELDSETLMRRFLTARGEALMTILRHGSPLSEEDLGGILDLPFPGLDEVMALMEIMALVARTEYDLIIVDTAPTGHTLRLLGLPSVMQGWTAYLDTLMAKHRYLSRLYTGSYRPDEADALITDLSRGLEGIGALLGDETRCRFVVVTLPEPMVLAETRRLLKVLVEEGIAVAALVINQVAMPVNVCAVCQRQAAEQADTVRQFETLRPGLALYLLPASVVEPQGAQRLEALFAGLRGAGEWLNAVAIAALPPPSEATSTPVYMPAPDPGSQCFVFCGKGGVGKTTLATAFALRLSHWLPRHRTLLISIDPAHSLSDCLGTSIGGIETPIGETSNLFAIEIDASRQFDELKAAFAHRIEALMGPRSAALGAELRFDREVLTGLLDLSPPGLDEITALGQLSRYVERRDYEHYVLDTAPTGHALRFLALPQLALRWLRALLRVVLKYPRLAEATGILREIHNRVREARRLLTDPGRCACYPVVTPGKLILAETERLVAALRRLRVPLAGMFVNRLLRGADGCGVCSARRREQARLMGCLKGAFPDLGFIEVPLVQGMGPAQRLDLVWEEAPWRR